MLRNMLLGTAAVLVAGLGSVAPSTAATLSGTFGITVWYGTNPNSPTSLSDPQMQALPTNPVAAGTPLYAGTYVGPVDFMTGQNSILAFLTSAGGTLSGNTAPLNHILSSGGATDITLMRLTFSVAGLATGSIDHDDGVSIFKAGTTSAPILDSSFPTSPISTDYVLPSGGSYDLWYAEVNGLPAVLDVDLVPASVPEPTGIALLGAGLLGLGLGRRRKAR